MSKKSMFRIAGLAACISMFMIAFKPSSVTKIYDICQGSLAGFALGLFIFGYYKDK